MTKKKIIVTLSKRYPTQVGRLELIGEFISHTDSYLECGSDGDLELANDVTEDAMRVYAGLIGEARNHRTPVSPKDLRKLHNLIFQRYERAYDLLNTKGSQDSKKDKSTT
jgi:RecB family exonuclease